MGVQCKTVLERHGCHFNNFGVRVRVSIIVQTVRITNLKLALTKCEAFFRKGIGQLCFPSRFNREINAVLSQCFCFFNPKASTLNQRTLCLISRASGSAK